jgi:hypothetical protein
MDKRNDSEKLFKELTLRFGEKDYIVPVRRMKDSAKWRTEYFERTKDINSSMIIDNVLDRSEVSKAVARGLMGALLAFPEKIPELVFSYAPSLPKDEILENAYDQEFALAFEKIWQVAFAPFLASLGSMMKLQNAQASQSPSSASLN